MMHMVQKHMSWLRSSQIGRPFAAFLLVFAFLCSACIESPFYVSDTSPVEGDSKVSRSTGILVQFIADGDVDSDFLSDKHFTLQKMGKVKKECTSSQTNTLEEDSSGENKDASTDKNKEEESKKKAEKDEDDKDDNQETTTRVRRGATKGIPLIVRQFSSEGGFGEEGLLNQVLVAVSPMELLEASSCYRLTVDDDVEDDEGNTLTKKFHLHFSTSKEPDGEEPRLLRSIPNVVGAADLESTSASTMIIDPDQPIFLEFEDAVPSVEAVRKMIAITPIDDVRTRSAIKFKLFYVHNPFREESGLTQFIVTAAIRGKVQFKFDDGDSVYTRNLEAKNAARDAASPQIGQRIPVHVHADIMDTQGKEVVKESFRKKKFFAEDRSAPGEDPFDR